MYDSSNRAASPISVISRIVFRVKVFEAKRPHRGYLRDVLAGFRPVEMGCVAREHDDAPGGYACSLLASNCHRVRCRKRLKSRCRRDLPDACAASASRRGALSPGLCKARFRGLPHDDGQPHGRWERRKWFPIDVVGQDGFENVLPGLVRPDFAFAEHGSTTLAFSDIQTSITECTATAYDIRSAVDVAYGCGNPNINHD